ncbi:hypothetical protein ANCCAN_19008 [Ancylostoma caninum]|uniref:Uncharacterized protein n=1 Tax=Ancylostoma caninum TaxID=29170 RepID=A0A368FSJ8_ANCCA|nr:hypothetical protein ANCCAN_19008 [Ancylostoma caninum]
MSVQRQLREDWDNREYEQIIADNVKNIANFLSSFGSFRFRTSLCTYIGLNSMLKLFEFDREPRIYR